MENKHHFQLASSLHASQETGFYIIIRHAFVSMHTFLEAQEPCSMVGINQMRKRYITIGISIKTVGLTQGFSKSRYTLINETTNLILCS